MRKEPLALVAVFLFFATPLLAGRAFAKAPAVTTGARKGPIAITLRLYSKHVKRKGSLWYQIELKNVGAEKIEIDDKIFRDPWAMHENIRTRMGLYLQVVGPPGKYQDVLIPEKGSPPLRVGAGQVKYDYGPGPGQTKELAPEDQRAFEAFQADLGKKGLSERERMIAQENWWQEWNRRKRLQEDLDPGRTLWLAPGASTSTIAWAYNESSDGREPAIPGYTQLWSYYLYYPGRYRIRLVYDHRLSDTAGANGIRPNPWDIRVATEYVDFEVSE